MNEKRPVNPKLSNKAEQEILSGTEAVLDDADFAAAIRKHQRAMRDEAQRVLRTREPGALIDAIQNFCTPPEQRKP